MKQFLSSLLFLIVITPIALYTLFLILGTGRAN